MTRTASSICACCSVSSRSRLSAWVMPFSRSGSVNVTSATPDSRISTVKPRPLLIGRPYPHAMDDVVRTELDDGVATITLDRPEHMNTMNGALLEQALSALERVAADDAV